MKKILFTVFVVCIPLLLGAQENDDDLSLKGEDMESLNAEFLQKVKTLEARKLSDLVHLSPFSDIAVIQRRFMPKTGRVSISALSTFTLSSEFFLNPGVEGHLTYHFLEKHGVELSGYYVLTLNRGVTDDMIGIGANVSELLPIARAFVGLTYKWMPVYGKIAFYNQRILAFDTFFNFGGGMSGVKRKKNPLVWEPVFIASIGQVFAITRNLGLRWDLRYHLTIETQNKAGITALHDILFSIGFSYYYPSAGLR